MASAGFDAEGFRAAQRAMWDRQASAWQRRWDAIERSWWPITERMLAVSGIRPGDTVLDVATGIGEPALSAARRVGPGGRVVGVDLAPGMVALARARAAQAGCANVTFEVADAERLPFADGFADAVLCRLGLMFVPDQLAMLRGCRRILKAGRRLTLAVWSAAERNPFAMVPMRALSAHMALPPSPAEGCGRACPRRTRCDRGAAVPGRV